MALAAVPEADGAVVGGGDEILACGGEFDVHDCGDVVFEDVEGAFEVASVEEVNVMVFVCGGEVEGFHWVPAEFVGCEAEGGFCQGGGGAEIVEGKGAIVRGGGEEGRLDRIEGEGSDCVGRGWPVKGL